MPRVSKPRPRRGRPRRTSKQELVDTAIKLLKDHPDAIFSLHSLAREVGISTMAIYRHVEDKDDLLQAVTAKLLENLKPEIPSDEPWQKQLEVWAQATRRHFLRYPGLLRIISWKNMISYSWLKHFAMLVRILRQANLDESDLAESSLWVSKVIMGMIEMEIATHRPETNWTLSGIDLSDVGEFEGDDLKLIWSNLLRQSFKKQFEDSIRYTTLAIESLAESNYATKRRTKRRKPA